MRAALAAHEVRRVPLVRAIGTRHATSRAMMANSSRECGYRLALGRCLRATATRSHRRVACGARQRRDRTEHTGVASRMERVEAGVRRSRAHEQRARGRERSHREHPASAAGDGGCATSVRRAPCCRSQQARDRAPRAAVVRARADAPCARGFSYAVAADAAPSAALVTSAASACARISAKRICAEYICAECICSECAGVSTGKRAGSRAASAADAASSKSDDDVRRPSPRAQADGRIANIDHRDGDSADRA